VDDSRDEACEEDGDDDDEQGCDDIGDIAEQSREDVRGLWQAEGINGHDEHHNDDEPIDEAADDFPCGSFQVAFFENFGDTGLVGEHVEADELEELVDELPDELCDNPAYDEDDNRAE